MKKHLIKILLLVILFSVNKIGLTNSYFSSGKVLGSNTFSTGCWVAPTVPILNYPLNNSYADSVWDGNPKMDWLGSSSQCEDSNKLTYQYESFFDPMLTQLAYSSPWLTNSFISAPGTPDGTYYWHVRVKDSFGNISEFSDPWKFLVDHKNVLAPQNLGWINPKISCGGYTNSFNATAIWDSVAGAASYMYEINYPKIGGGRGNWQNLVKTPKYTGAFNQDEGLHTYRVYAIGSVGNTSPWSSSCSVIYDKTVPTSTITKPWNSNNDNEIDYPIVWFWDGKVEGTSTDNLSGVHHVELSIHRQIADKYWDGFSWVDGTESSVRVHINTENNWSYQIDPLYIPFGKFKIIAHAVDNAGNMENSATIEFENINPVPPCQPDVNLSVNNDRASFTATCISKFTTLNYELIYLSENTEKGLNGTINIDNQSEITRDNLILGSCSSLGEVCNYHKNTADFKLKVDLISSDGQVTTIVKELL